MIQSNHGGAGLKAKSAARTTKRTVFAAAGIAGKRADKRTSRVDEASRPAKTPKTSDENVPREVAVAVAAPENVVGKSSVTGHDESVDGNNAPRQTYESTWTADNYVWLLQKSLTNECQSHIILKGSCCLDAATPGIGEDEVAVLVKRAMTAVQVPNLYL